ncbi:DUF4199 domain-containing protein [Dokdonia sp. Hel_I_53]|uniref:DUF4199 domain-containing protein n=1 Tax=Dokdonia sp. Hel_I_53 TaxID=1566287 RepID=UPI001199E66D|nr:DUF4199 domain-containing protein [Dokdonia sp. Hel_I_53]TVZ52127.1 Protein of unknown function (DUF4199) [Dokdonia sp. Hel_I_53]
MSRFTMPIRFAIAMAAGLIAYFLILSLFDLHTQVLFSLFNGVIVGFGIFEVIKYTKIRKGASFSYSDGLVNGVVSGFIATLLFTGFFALYAGNINPEFLDGMIGPWQKTYNTSIGAVIFTVAICGFASAICLALCFMQLFKPSWNTQGTNKILKDRGDSIRG